MEFKTFCMLALGVVLGAMFSYFYGTLTSISMWRTKEQAMKKYIVILSNIYQGMKYAEMEELEQDYTMNPEMVQEAVRTAIDAMIILGDDMETIEGFEIRPDEEKFLIQYATNYDDDRVLDCTHMPLITVSDVRYQEVADGCGDEKWYRVGEECLKCSSVDEVMEIIKVRLFNEDRESIEEIRQEVIKFGCFYDGAIVVEGFDVKKEYRPIAYFLTHAEANDYINYQKHNLENPMILSCTIGEGNKGDLKNLMKLAIRYGGFLKGKKERYEEDGHTISKDEEVKKVEQTKE